MVCLIKNNRVIISIVGVVVRIPFNFNHNIANFDYTFNSSDRHSYYYYCSRAASK